MHDTTDCSQTEVDSKAPIPHAHLVDREQIGVFTARTGKVSQKPEEVRLRGRTGAPQLQKRLLQSLPRRVSRVYHRALGRRNKEDIHTSGQVCAHPAPLIAPPPSQENANDRLGPGLEERSRIPPLREFVQNPLLAAKEAIQNRGEDEFAENIGKTAVNHGADVALVLENARVRDSTGEDSASSDEDVLGGLKQSRQDFFTRWTVDRHVRNVRRIPPCKAPLRGRNEFLERDEQGREEMDWIGYGQHLWQCAYENCTPSRVEEEPEFPNPSPDLLISSLERVLVSSRPVQRLFIYLRQISGWENPLESGLLMFAYFSFLISRCIPQITFIIVKVLYRHLCPPTIGDMHPQLVQSEDKTRQAEDLSELITKHGPRGWVDRLVEMAGPMLLYHSESLADTLEIIQNFYEWRNPRETWLCLFRLTVLLALLVFLPTWLLVESLFAISGLLFFATTPVSVFCPEYQIFTSPCTWIFGRTPTHADWAIARLQEEARQQLYTVHQDQALERERRAGEAKRRSDPSEVKDEQTSGIDETRINIGSYKCRDGHRGRLVLTSGSATFLPSRLQGQEWSVAYTTLKGIHKISASTTFGQAEGLLFVDSDGIKHEVTDLKSRDLVFSQIIGYSNVRWRKTE